MNMLKKYFNTVIKDPALYLFLFLSGLLMGDYIMTHKINYSIPYIILLCIVYTFIVQFIYFLIKRKLK